jgi:glycosidase
MIKRTLLAHAMTYFMRGVPIIYYGDEQGFVGDGGDQASRQDMRPSLVESYNDDDLLATDATTADDNFDINHPIYQSFAQYADIFFRYPALRRGEQHTVFQADNNPIFAVSRSLVPQSKNSNKDTNSEMLIVFNTADKIAKANFKLEDGNYRLVTEKNAPILSSKDIQDVEFQALSFSIFEKIITP